ncbi:type VI secretion system tip protein VgrG [Chitinophaga nivalis]|uniref:Type VI secretion system tip protein VgrG n=1 Tax=Chitinophaga nivalis TaxID=2991709 RepID=A0ABT3IPM8_9BACT|nr:type VI secretion system tip protein VgrG [Chitinophaga nivalis]MCW3464569.1 type VI secretion system tip protein VgrG [Chitinophaga nivalis]MCW3485740.1 type VI secretion system tip protein VgrG [Chitinophaga nivalis]
MPDITSSKDERIIPTPGVYDYTQVQVLINGNKLDNPAYNLRTITVVREMNMIPFARITVLDGDVADEKFAVSEAADFIPGNKIEVKVGRDGQEASVFKGVIVKHGIKAGENGEACLQIDCRDECVKLTLGRKNRYFTNVTDTDALKTVLGAIAGKLEATAVKHKELVQYYCTDWDFAMSRAEMNGCLLLADAGKVNMIKPALAGSPALTLVYGATIDEFEAEIDARTQWQEVNASAWSYKDQALKEASTSSSSFKEAGNLKGSTLAGIVSPAKLELRHSGQVSEPELKAWTDAFLLKSRMAKIRGRAKIKGSPATKPGDTIELKGLGKRFNGLVYVSGVRHEYHDGIWTTHLQFGISPEWFHHKPEVMETPAAGLLPAVSGLQIGIVVQLENDPDGEDRILVKMPLVDNREKGTWARVASLDAGKERGYFFRPELNDEVIVGFVNGDPRFAVVLGMLHSSAKPAPVQAKDTNHIKGLVTRSKMKTMFDDENKVMRMETPAGNSIELSEKDKAITITDQHNNMIKMEAGGITIKSAKDITMEASGLFSLKAKTDVTLEGMTIAGKSNTSIELSAQSTAKFTASAMMEMKGGIVKIN